MLLRLSPQIHTVLSLVQRSRVPVLPLPLPLPLGPVVSARPPYSHWARAYHSSTILLLPSSAGSCSRRTFLRQYSGTGTGTGSSSPGSHFPSPSPSPSAQGPLQATGAETGAETHLPAQHSADPGRSQYDRPSYELTFTCKPCGHRSTHVISKQAYHHGTTLVKCPDCNERHVISDHLKVRATYLS